MSDQHIEKPAAKTLPDGWRWTTFGEVCKQDRQIVEPNSKAAVKLQYISLEHVESNTGRILRQGGDGQAGQRDSFKQSLPVLAGHGTSRPCPGDPSTNYEAGSYTITRSGRVLIGWVGPTPQSFNKGTERGQAIYFHRWSKPHM
jgi:hypothetical protein